MNSDDLTLRLIEHCSPEQASRESVTQAVAAWRAARAKRLEIDKLAAQAKEAEVALKNWLLEAMRSQAYEGIVTGGRITALVEKQQPVVEDKTAFVDYILTSGAIELLQFRLSTTAINERAEHGIAVPGIGFAPVFELSDRKA